jgi:hypothetical protein
MRNTALIEDGEKSDNETLLQSRKGTVLIETDHLLMSKYLNEPRTIIFDSLEKNK